IEPDWLLELFADRIVEEVDVSWNATAERVEATERMTFGALVLDERPAGASAAIAIARELLARANAAGGIDGVLGVDDVARLRTRIDFVRENAPDLAEAAGLAALDDAAVVSVLRAACEGHRSFAELRRAALLDELRFAIGHAAIAKLDRLAPELVTLGNGRRVKVTYARGERPSIGSRLQDFFGSTTTPRLLENRVAVTLHLHAPNGRDVQVTSDLESFWSRAYPAVRSELMRRYPRHPWPEDPRTAAPPPLRRPSS
ncbi:MAG: ATP-dependent helicase C-terminal domain-containing protein, partial [Polyangiales bacterium]